MNVTTLAMSEEVIPVLAIGGGLAVAVISIICGTIRRTVETKSREESRREIAAYVAEGSMSADDAFKLLSAKTGKPSKNA
jgi:hypothetical protein